MRRTSRRTSRGPAQPTVGVSLFPFLAVLTCTMGALILLLVVVTRQARARATESALAEAAQRDDDFRVQRDLARQQTQGLEASLREAQSESAGARSELGHLEDQARRLRNQLARLQETAGELYRLHGNGRCQRSDLEAEYQQVQARLATARRRLAEAEQAARQQPRPFAVIPYRGPHQTYRRPIYIECRCDAIVLQPEGIILTEADLAGPLGPGNPLAAALRAAREHLLPEGSADPERSGEPYPLMLVRPHGIAAYYAARAAMKSWGSEFGYELIGEDWQLQFQPPDPQLAQVMQDAINAARVRQQQLSAAAPSRYGQPEPVWYRAAPTRGGSIVDAGPQAAGRSTALWQPPAGRPADRVASDTEAHQPWAPGSDRPQGNATALQPGDRRAGEPSDAQFHSGQDSHPRLDSLARHRGQNWGLPDATVTSVPVGRAIHVRCLGDRLEIVPEQGPARSRSIPLSLRTEESVDELVSAVWEHMRSWGIAGNGMHWRPILSIQVAPDAEQRYADLSTLLEGSGLILERTP